MSLINSNTYLLFHNFFQKDKKMTLVFHSKRIENQLFKNLLEKMKPNPGCTSDHGC